MIHRVVPSKQIGRILTCLMLMVCYRTSLMAQNQSATDTPVTGSTLRVTHVLGFQGISNKATGHLFVQGESLRFQKSHGAAAQVPIGSIQDVILGEEDKQTGGVPMALARTAAPYGGGRVISLFSHKKYDTVTLEYLDSEGGFHGAIFELNKGEGQVLKSDLAAKGAHVTPPETENKQSAQETNNDVK
jgi:hypothetical protein